MFLRSAVRSALKLPGYFTAGDGVAAAAINTGVALRRWSETLVYETSFGRLPNYVRPATYTEKLQWRKMFDRNPELVTFSDKIAARDLAKARAPQVHLPELLWTGTDPDAIPFHRLEPPYVMKANNRSSATAFVRDERDADPAGLRAAARQWLGGSPHRRWAHEWTYGLVESRILIEEFLAPDDDGNSPPDLKIFVFGGRARYLYHRDPVSGERRIYDPDWNGYDWDRWARLTRVDRTPYLAEIERPPNLDAAIAVAEAIAGDLDHLRVDLYNLDGKIYFGEATVFPSSGNKIWIRHDDPADPHPDPDIDRQIGSHWVVPDLDRRTMVRRGMGRRARV